MAANTKNVPKLRFPGFSGEWEEKRLGELTSKVGSGSTPRGGSDVYKKSGIPFIRSQNVVNGQLDLSDTVYIDEKTHALMKNTKVLPSDVLLNITGASLGRSCVVPADFREGNVSQHVCIIRMNSNANPYIVHSILSKPKSLHELLKSQTGGGKEGLNFQAVRAFKVTLPAQNEQQKIAGFLGVVDDRISGLRKKVELLRKYKKGIMQKIFSQEIRFKPARPVGQTGGDENDKEYPAWQEKELRELGHTYNGLQGKAADDFGSGKSFITYKQIFDDSKIDFTKSGKVRIEQGERQNLSQYGDIFFTTSSETPGEVGFASVQLEKYEAYLNSFCFGFRPNNLENLLPEFARYMFRGNGFRRSMFKLAQGSTRYNISKSGFMKTRVMLPKKEEQQKIADFLTSIDEKIEAEERELEQAKKFKKALLQQMFV